MTENPEPPDPSNKQGTCALIIIAIVILGIIVLAVLSWVNGQFNGFH